MNKEDIVKVEQVSGEYLTQDQAEFDIAVATARKFPRMVSQSVERSIQAATIDSETAKSCSYAVPRADKKITGNSVQLARIVARNWGNMRVSKTVTREESKFINAEAVAWDLETNFAVKANIRRRITNKSGVRYNDDMIQTAGLAAAAIAERTAIFSVVDSVAVDKVRKATIRMITGDLTNEEKLIKRRGEMFAYFEKTYGVSKQRILKYFGFRSETQINADEIVMLIAADNTLKNRESTVDEMFPLTTEDSIKAAREAENAKKKDGGNKPKAESKKDDLKSENKDKGDTPPVGNSQQKLM